MKKVKGKIIFIVFFIIIAGAAVFLSINLGSSNWDKRFRTELDRFFGEGNWECVSFETKESIIYEEYHSSREIPDSGATPGKYKNWYISVTDASGEKSLWTITNHALKINHKEYGVFSSKRLSNKQAFVLELFEIACADAGEEVLDHILGSVLSEDETECFRVEISYDNGNPKPEFYDQLWEEKWFTADQLTAGDFLTSELYDFYIDIYLHDYRFEKLSEEEQEHVLNSFTEIEAKLLAKYGESASFDMYFDDEHNVKYRDGVKIIKNT